METKTANLPRVFVFTRREVSIKELIAGLRLKGYFCKTFSSEEDLAGSEQADLLLIDANGNSGTELKNLTQKIKQDRTVLIIILGNKYTLRDIEKDSDAEDFLLEPYNLDELAVRIQRLMRRRKPREESPEYIKSGDLAIDLPRCEVTLAGKVVDLTFKEYELLKYLITHKGRVLTRETLLNKIWGYDYFGGDRTVDVHIRRLRSKIEDTSHNFIETVRNIGYCFKSND